MTEFHMRSDEELFAEQERLLLERRGIDRALEVHKAKVLVLRDLQRLMKAPFEELINIGDPAYIIERLEDGEDINTRNSRTGNTVAISALEREIKEWKLFEYCVLHGADLTLTNNLGKGIYDYVLLPQDKKRLDEILKPHPPASSPTENSHAGNGGPG